MTFSLFLGSVVRHFIPQRREVWNQYVTHSIIAQRQTFVVRLSARIDPTFAPKFQFLRWPIQREALICHSEVVYRIRLCAGEWEGEILHVGQF